MNKDIFLPPKAFRDQANISLEQYKLMYEKSVNQPKEFWAEQARENLDWFRSWDEVLSYDFSKIGTSEEPYAQFFSGGEINVSYNCLDRHVKAGLGDKVAIIWQGEDDEESLQITYSQLLERVCKMANLLKQNGVKKGDRVTIYMPMIPELAISVLACARLGAVHSVVFSAFSSSALESRMIDCDSRVLITSSLSNHAGKKIDLKKKSDELSLDLDLRVIVDNSKVDREGVYEKDVLWSDVVDKLSSECEPCRCSSEDPLFILYTSGSTGKPKGVLHTTAGYLLYVHLTTKYIFDLKKDDVYWCSADVGWITGHSYLVYGPLSNCATCVMYESTPTYPEPDRFWQIIEKHKVSIFYTAPTAIRALMKLGDEYPNSRDLSSLRLLGSVGEPINPEAWLWYYKTIGGGKCPIVDTWWQTETGGICLTTLPGAMDTKPGAAGLPFFGIVPKVLDQDLKEAKAGESGSLVITKPWPSMIRGVFGDKKSERVKTTYFSLKEDVYFTGDGCLVDKDGYHWLLGRIDDVINVSAHRFSTAEIESALVEHKDVCEAAVVGMPHDTKGQGIYCYVTLNEGVEGSEEINEELVQHVREEIGPIATPEFIQFAPSLPKTRSGKIMRRILRKIAEGEFSSLGDTTTLADPSVVDELVDNSLYKTKHVKEC